MAVVVVEEGPAVQQDAGVEGVVGLLWGVLWRWVV